MAANKDDFSIKKITPKLGGERGNRNPNGPTSSHDLVEQMEFLYVEVIKAVNNSVVNPKTNTCIPIVEITLGNYKSSTETLPIGPNREWNQVFAFDKTRGDVLSVTLKDGQLKNGNVIGKQSFKLATDIPSRYPPDARIAPQWYSIESTEPGYHMILLMSIWFGTQADEVYSQAWFSDASGVSASCVINTRPKLYLAPRLCYVRVTIVSGHDLISSDGKRAPSVYVKATLGQTALKTVISTGSNPSWNQDLIFVASEPLDGTVYITLMDKVDDQHEECIGKLKKKLSEMTPLKIPGSAPALFYDIEPPGNLESAFKSKRFSSTIKMKLATDQAYHVFDECSLYSSDYRAYAKGLWPGALGKLEIGILGATNLQPMKDSLLRRNAYVVAKYGNKWARTRTVVDNSCPKWNEQYSWDVYERSTVVTLGIYDNQQLVSSYQRNDDPIGKVRIPLSLLHWNRTYACSVPVLSLGSGGLKRMGELQLAVRFSNVMQSYAFAMSYLRWMLPKAHYKSPLSLRQIEQLRAEAVKVNINNLSKTEPPLRNEVVTDMLKPKSKSFSMRKAKANLERLCKTARWLSSGYVWVGENVRETTSIAPKVLACVPFLVLVFFPWWILWLTVCWILPMYFGVLSLSEVVRFCYGEVMKWKYGVDKSQPLILFDINLSKLDSVSVDELAEELDSFPSSETDVNVLRMRYDRLRKMGENVVLFMGDLASQCDRVYALWTFCDDQNVPLGKVYLCVVCYLVVGVVYSVPYQLWLICLFCYWLKLPCLRNDLPNVFDNFFRRLPSNDHLML